MADIHNDLAIFQEFREALGTRDPKTIATYLTTMRDFVAWLAAQPGGTPFLVNDLKSGSGSLLVIQIACYL